MGNYPHIIGFRGLLRSQMEDDSYLLRISERRQWLTQHCEHEYMLDDLLDERGAAIGKAYRFADLTDAMWFRLAF